jgi:hypothetical protein
MKHKQVSAMWIVRAKKKKFHLFHTTSLPLPPRGVLCAAQSKSQQHPRQGYSFTYQLKN